ncbi:MAG TPA: TIGR02300 family protein [Stellaceae bacterium]|nr:TIGR02300 family protein [Stellaceae bacterium]
MAKSELGTKRVCPETGRKFYDLNKDPVISPYTGKVVPVEVAVSRARPEPVAARPAPVAEEVAAPEPAEAEFVSLEEADAETAGAAAKKPGEPAEAEIEDEEVEMDESLDDAAFIEEQEEEDADVTDIIGGDIENEEEG